MLCSTLPSGKAHKRSKGFSKTRMSRRKKPSVTRPTRMTHGKNSRSRSHFRSVTAEVKADISQAQKSKEPACPPHKAVALR